MRAMAKASGGTPPRKTLTVAESAHRARTAKGAKCRATEASLLQWAHAQEEPLDRDMLTLGGSATAVLVKLCGEPFAVLSDGMVNLDHGAFRHCPVLRSDLTPILFLEAVSYDETPMTARQIMLWMSSMCFKDLRFFHPFAALFQLKAH